MMIPMQQRMKRQAWIFATTHWKDFSNSILFLNYFHATFLPFRSAYGLHLQVILMTVVWQSYGMLFATTISHTIKKSWQLEFNCWEFQNVPFSSACANVSLVFNYGWVFNFARFWLYSPPALLVGTKFCVQTHCGVCMCY
jgi:hypothetical protein